MGSFSRAFSASFEGVSFACVALALVLLGALVTSPRTAASENDFNLTFHPLLLRLGVKMGFDVPIAEQWVLGADLGGFRFKGDNENQFFDEKPKVRIGLLEARGVWYPYGVYKSGWYLSPRAGVWRVEIDGKRFGSTVTGDATLLMLSALGGYQWFWENLNIGVGGGLVAAAGETEVEVTDSTGTQKVDGRPFGSAALEVILGWAF